MPASISALVLIPTTAALWKSESKKSAFERSSTRADGSRGQIATAPESLEVHAAATGRRSAGAAGSACRPRRAATPAQRGRPAATAPRTAPRAARSTATSRCTARAAGPPAARPARRTRSRVVVGLAHEPLVEDLRARSPRPARPGCRAARRLALLVLVPDGHQVRRDLDQPFVGQVVPACHADAGGDAERARRS